MAKTTRSYALLLIGCSAIGACRATSFVGVTCADDSCALSTEERGLTCSIYERTLELGIRDLPFDHPQLGLCTYSPLRSDDDGLVHCRVAWKFVGGAHDGTEPRCEDYDFLSPLGEDVFSDDDGQPACLVRQVTKAQAGRGKSGWYYVSSSPEFCLNGGPAVIIPRQRPDSGGWQVQAFLQCSAVQTVSSSGEVEDVDIAECAAPRETRISDLGAECTRNLSQADGADSVSLDLDPQQCESSACVTMRLPEPICERSPSGVQFCRNTLSACSCRCAGEGDDPGPFCECPDTHECKPFLSGFTGSPETRGSYCVQKGMRP